MGQSLVGLFLTSGSFLRDLRWVHDESHAAFTMADLGAVQPDGIGAVDLESPDVSVVGESRVDTHAAGERHAGSVEGALCDRVA